MESLLSLGLDIGTSTTQLVFSRLQIANRANAWSVPDIAITEKQILYRSAVHFTPLRSNTIIDCDRIRQLVDLEYQAAGIPKSLESFHSLAASFFSRLILPTVFFI